MDIGEVEDTVCLKAEPRGAGAPCRVAKAVELLRDFSGAFGWPVGAAHISCASYTNKSVNRELPEPVRGELQYASRVWGCGAEFA